VVRTDRRGFLKHGLVAAGGLGLGVYAWSKFARLGPQPEFHEAFGPLQPVIDQTSGLPILKLPEGFRYHSFAWAGETLGDGYTSPMFADGMGVVGEENGIITLIRNHEVSASGAVIGDPRRAWDTSGGGTSTLRFDVRKEQLVDSNISLAGTLENCAGGVTPWGTWLSCEEAPVTPELLHHGTELRQKFWGLDNVRKSHGYVFEVHPQGESNPQPIIPMGQFYHEAAAVDPQTGIVYMTEDRSPHAGLYRYVPDIPGELMAGGGLQMLRVEGRRELNKAVALNKPMAIDWVNISDPAQGHTPGTHDCSGVVKQGIAAGATAFTSLEGCAIDQGVVFFTSKSGGKARAGQVYRLDIAHNTLQLIYEATDRNGFSGLDNIIVSPAGSLMICEDRIGLRKKAQYIAALTTAGELFAFCQTNPDLNGSFNGHVLQDMALISEWAGVCFSADGQWMFANLYKPGITFAITGPWDKGPV
jgi:secreted PhoX family phosphatase